MAKRKPKQESPEPTNTNKEVKTMPTHDSFQDDGEVIDFTKIHDSNKVPDGDYLALVTFSEPDISKAGHKKINLRWKITDGDYEGVVLFDNMSFAPGALWRTQQSLIGCGFPEDYAGSVRDIALEMLNVEALISVKTDTKPSTQIDPATGEPYPQRPRIIRIRPADTMSSIGAAFGDSDD
jgi:hypothetical protein